MLEYVLVYVDAFGNLLDVVYFDEIISGWSRQTILERGTVLLPPRREWLLKHGHMGSTQTIAKPLPTPCGRYRSPVSLSTTYVKLQMGSSSIEKKTKPIWSRKMATNLIGLATCLPGPWQFGLILVFGSMLYVSLKSPLFNVVNDSSRLVF
jgi:hypothetical protein